MKDPDGRQDCILYASCLGHAIKYFLELSDDFNGRYVIKPQIYHNVTFLTDIAPKMEPQLGGCSVFIYHEPEALPQQVYDEALTQACEKLAPDATKIALPLPYFHAFWPFQCNDPRNGSPDRRLNRYGTHPYYHYGDNYVLALLKQGLPPEEVISRYLALDVSTEIDLDALLRGTLSMIERNERNGVVKVADLVSSNFRSEKLFQTFNHPNNRLLLHMANQILKTLDCRQISDSVLATVTEIIEEPMPIHPSIPRYYGASYIDENTRYSVDHIRYMTFAEFIRDYVYYNDGLILWGN